MQKVQPLLHPMVMVTHAECGTSRRAGRVEGMSSIDKVSSQISVTGPHSSAWSRSVRTRCRLWVPNTTSTQGAFAITLTALFVLKELAGVHYLIANLLGIGLGFFWNFTFNVLWTWRARPTVSADPYEPEVA